MNPYNRPPRSPNVSQATGTLPVTKGGTGSTTVAGAQTALELKKGIEPNNVLPYWAAIKS